MEKTKIGILGAGVVGQSLARALIPHGHEIMLSSRQPQGEKMQRLVSDLGVQAGTVAETVAFGDLLALALGWDAIPQVIPGQDFGGKILIDMSNRFTRSDQAAAQDLAQMATGARVVKAFNTIGAEHYPAPDFDGTPASMFIAGDDPAAKQIVAQLIAQLGFDVVDAGDLSAARHLESLAAFWVHLALRTPSGRGVAFKLLRR